MIDPLAVFTRNADGFILAYGKPILGMRKESGETGQDATLGRAMADSRGAWEGGVEGGPRRYVSIGST